MHIDGNHIVCRDGEKWDQSIMEINTKNFVRLRNIRNNIRRQFPQFASYSSNSERVALVCGGWSLRDTFEELRALSFSGVGLVAVNGSARWLMERNLRPAMHIILDARPENLEFLADPIPGCKYFLSSQCDSSLFEACEGRDVTIFHAVSENAEPENRRLNSYYNSRWVRIPPCGTVGLTSLLLLRLLGFQHIHLFGADSCCDPQTGAHHGYAQSLNDNDGCRSFRICEREFLCSAWQASQIQSFLNLMAVNGDALRGLVIHGEGALAHILKVGPELADAALKEA